MEMTIACYRCHGLFPPDPNHPGHAAPHNCEYEARGGNRQPTHDELSVSPLEFITAASTVHAEVVRSTAKHPHYPRDPLRRVMIVYEERDEASSAAQAVLDLTRTKGEGFAHHDLDGARERLREELTHMASAAMLALIAMRREDKADASR